MKAVTYDKVKLGGFWKNRFEINKNVTIPAVYERFSETGRFAAFNCDWHEGMEHKPHFFWDSDIAKWIELSPTRCANAPTRSLRPSLTALSTLLRSTGIPAATSTSISPSASPRTASPTACSMSFTARVTSSKPLSHIMKPRARINSFT